MQSLYTYERNLLEPDDDDKEPLTFEKAVGTVVQALTSFGSFSSAVAPYSIVQNVAFDYAGYDKKARDVVGRISISKALQSPYGDNADQISSYTLTREMMKAVAEKAPRDVKNDVTRIMIAFDVAQRDYEQRQKESLKHIINRLGAGTGRKMEAPQPAKFKKPHRNTRNARPRR